MSVRVEHGDSRDVIKTMADASIHAVVCDPPYSLVSIQKRFGKPGQAPATEGVYRRTAAGFMGASWDNGTTAFDPAFWAEVLRVLKPGGHLVAFGGTRTYHRLACAIEDGGFEIRDQIGWAFGSGFPKSHDVSKGIDKAAGMKREVVRRHIQSVQERKSGFAGENTPFGAWQYDVTAPATAAARQWQGWGTALKPAWEPVCLARKPLIGTVAANVQQHGTGALNIDGCRVSAGDGEDRARPPRTPNAIFGGGRGTNLTASEHNAAGRWPANLIHDGSEEVLAAFPDNAGGGFGKRGDSPNWGPASNGGGSMETVGFGDSGTAARFFYSAKADAADRLGSKHPTVKPVDLMAYLCRLITPIGGTVLDPFAGSGSTGMACMREGFDCILIEREAEYVADIQRRLLHVDGSDAPLFAEVAAE